MNWYILRIVSGNEQSVKSGIEMAASNFDFTNKIEEILIPEEKFSVVSRSGKKIKKTKNPISGYMLIKMVDNKDLFSAVKNVRYVSGFLEDDSGKPSAVDEAQLSKMLEVIEGRSARTAAEDCFSVGDTVDIISGPFSNFVGEISELNDLDDKMKVSVLIFGQPTIVEVTYIQAKISKSPKDS